jgi:hypothetical protein
MEGSVYACHGPYGRAEVLPVIGDRYAIYRWHNGGLYVEGTCTALEDAKKWARAVTGCKHGNDT